MHEEEVDVAGVVNEEGLVAGGHHVAGLLVGSETNLYTLLEVVLRVGSEVSRWAKSSSFKEDHLSHATTNPRAGSNGDVPMA